MWEEQGLDAEGWAEGPTGSLASSRGRGRLAFLLEEEEAVASSHALSCRFFFFFFFWLTSIIWKAIKMNTDEILEGSGMRKAGTKRRLLL